MKLQNKVTLVTGGASGIGLRIAEEFIANGATAVLADVNGEAAIHAAAAIPGKAVGIACDVSNHDSVFQMVQHVLDRFGKIDVLVNCAGIGPQAPFLDLSHDIWNRTIGINLTGTFLCSQIVARQMVKNGSGVIINIASISGIRAGTGRTAYGTTKAGIIQLTKQMAIELGPRGIRANVISPGPVDTPLTKQVHTPAQRARYNRQIPLGRYGETEEMAQAALFLASSDSSYINGHNLIVDGGFCIAGLLTPEDQDS